MHNNMISDLEVIKPALCHSWHTTDTSGLTYQSEQTSSTIQPQPDLQPKTKNGIVDQALSYYNYNYKKFNNDGFVYVRCSYIKNININNYLF